MESLLDETSPFAPLQQVCERLGIHFELFGGCLTRLVTYSSAFGGTSDSVDLFALCPPFTDIDLGHSGPSSINPAIRREILSVVPTSECFHWELQDRRQLAKYRRINERNSVIPACRMTLSSDPRIGFRDPFDGRRDIRDRQYRYSHNSSNTDLNCIRDRMISSSSLVSYF